MPRILIVDDESNNRLLLATILEHGGYAVSEASNGADALKNVRMQVPDLIVMDLQMPGMSGVDFLRMLRAEPDLAHVKVALYTATITNPDLRQLMESTGVEHVISKPLDPSQVLGQVSAILAT